MVVPKSFNYLKRISKIATHIGSESGSSRVCSQHVDAAILVHSFDVSTDVSLPLAAVITMRTLEARLLAALVTQMPLQGAFPYEYAGTLGALILLVIGTILPYLFVETRGIDICEHRAIPIGY